MDKHKAPLGKKVIHSKHYDPSQLFGVDRSIARESIHIKEDLPFYGQDLWTAFELSWLNMKGKPLVAVGQIVFPCTSPCIIESKSLKLYFNSLNQSRFESADQVKAIMEKDLSRVSGAAVRVDLILPNRFGILAVGEPEGTCIDDLDIEADEYEVNPSLLGGGQAEVNETLYSNLLRTNCPVTEQPDWATVVIEYSGRQILHESLLAYLVSFREHTGFHENCVEKIFMDIIERCSPKTLMVYARFTRRGGVDINPCRSTEPVSGAGKRLVRQ